MVNNRDVGQGQRLMGRAGWEGAGPNAERPDGWRLTATGVPGTGYVQRT